MRALELAGRLLEAEAARPRTRQFIGSGDLQVVCSFRPMPERLGAFMGCVLPVGGRSRPVTPRPRQNVLPTRVVVVLQIVETSKLITASRAAITKSRSPIAVLRRSQPRRGTLLPYG